MLQLGLGLGQGNGVFPFFFFLFVLKVTNTFVLHVNGSCDVHGVRGVRTTTVHDVTMMYCKEQYVENVPFFLDAMAYGTLWEGIPSEAASQPLSPHWPPHLKKAGAGPVHDHIVTTFC